MTSDELDITDLLVWEDGLPRPRWDLIGSWFESHRPPDGCLGRCRAGSGWANSAPPSGGYVRTEADNFLALVPAGDEFGPPLLQFGERCRDALVSSLRRGRPTSTRPGSRWWSCCGTRATTTATCRCTPRTGSTAGHSGSTSARTTRTSPSRAASCGPLENSLAHELTHAALHHLGDAAVAGGGAGPDVRARHDRAGLGGGGREAGRPAQAVLGQVTGWTSSGGGRGSPAPGRCRAELPAGGGARPADGEEGRPRWFGWDQRPRRAGSSPSCVPRGPRTAAGRPAGSSSGTGWAGWR